MAETPPHLSHIDVKAYKNIRELSLDLRPLNILIGPNGSGKSNFLSLFQLFAMGADDRLAQFVREQGGYRYLAWREPGGEGASAPEIYLRLTLQNLKHVQPDKPSDPIYYEVRLGQKNNGFILDYERLSQGQEVPEQDNYKNTYLINRGGAVISANSGIDFTGTALTELFELAGNLSKPSEYREPSLSLSDFREATSNEYPLLNEVRQYLLNWVSFRGFGESSLRNIREGQESGRPIPFRLDPQGRNVVALIDALANDSRYDSVYDDLNRVMKMAFPYFKKFDVRHSDTVSLERTLFWRIEGGLDFPTRSLSDGMLRFLGLALLLLLPRPGLITIDEPEIGLHPQLLPLLLDLMKQASEKTQLIVTTHSPLLLDEDIIELDDILLVDRKEDTGEASFTRPDKEKLGKWLENYNLGALWTMGKLS